MTHLLLAVGIAGSIGHSPIFSPVIVTSSVVEGNSRFALELYGKLKEAKGNLFLSPFSISTALAMTSTGAKGQTLSQMAGTLHLPTGAHAGFDELLKKFNAADPKAYQLSVANSLFGQKGYPWLPNFLRDTARDYGAGLKEVDYAANSEAARNEINGWAENQTRKKIVGLLPPGSVDAATRLVLVNAVYFKGDWKTTFDPKATRKAKFAGPGGEGEVDLMWAKGRYSYAENADYQTIALPYAQDKLSMVIVLPTKKDGLPAVEAKLTGDTVVKAVAGMVPTDASIFLPQFKMESSFDLGTVLSGMGMADAFDADRADFSGMDGRRDLRISKVVHKSFVEVNERGTEAAAATAVIMAPAAMRQEKPAPVVRCDHPFLFLIRDNATGSILFLGRLNDPK